MASILALLTETCRNFKSHDKAECILWQLTAVHPDPMTCASRLSPQAKPSKKSKGGLFNCFVSTAKEPTRAAKPAAAAPAKPRKTISTQVKRNPTVTAAKAAAADAPASRTAAANDESKVIEGLKVVEAVKPDSNRV